MDLDKTREIPNPRPPDAPAASNGEQDDSTAPVDSQRLYPPLGERKNVDLQPDPDDLSPDPGIGLRREEIRLQFEEAKLREADAEADLKESQADLVANEADVVKYEGLKAKHDANKEPARQKMTLKERNWTLVMAVIITFYAMIIVLLGLVISPWAIPTGALAGGGGFYLLKHWKSPSSKT